MVVHVGAGSSVVHFNPDSSALVGLDVAPSGVRIRGTDALGRAGARPMSPTRFAVGAGLGFGGSALTVERGVAAGAEAAARWRLGVVGPTVGVSSLLEANEGGVLLTALDVDRDVSGF
jgi:hypothetical protein